MPPAPASVLLSAVERDFLVDNHRFNPGYRRVIRSRLHKKIEVFVKEELPLLVEKGLLGVTEFRNVTENCNALNGSYGAIERAIATRDFYAPWSGREQCEQNPCWKAYGNASNRIWQTASSG